MQPDLCVTFGVMQLRFHSGKRLSGKVIVLQTSVKHHTREVAPMCRLLRKWDAPFPSYIMSAMTGGANVFSHEGTLAPPGKYD